MVDRDLDPRVFVSSVMEGFATFRQAASAAIRRAGGVPVSAEMFPAMNVSSRTACLDHVQSADGVVLILGARYGSPLVDNLSPTQEEYEEAMRLKKPVFVFVQKGDREPRQAEFIAKVERYVEGRFRRSFTTPEELGLLVEQAIRAHEWVSTPAMHAGEQAATRRMDAAFAERPRQEPGLVWLCVAWTPVRSEEVLDPVQFKDADYQDKIMAMTLAAHPRLFSYDSSKTRQSTATFLRLVQQVAPGGHGRDMVELTLSSEGTITILANVTGLPIQTPQWGDISIHWNIDVANVRRRLQQAWGFAARFWQDRDPGGRYDDLLHNLALYGVEGHRLVQNPVPSNSYTFPSHSPRDPVMAYPHLRRVVRRDLLAPEQNIEQSIGRLDLVLPQ